MKEGEDLRKWIMRDLTYFEHIGVSSEETRIIYKLKGYWLMGTRYSQNKLPKIETWVLR